MLTDLFRLNGTPLVVEDSDDPPETSYGSSVSDIVFNNPDWLKSPKGIKNVRFINVSISRGRAISKTTFTDCHFEDCVFLGAVFSEVEFHNCVFVNCNFWKAKFEQVYLDPSTISFDRRYKREAANAGISLYQALLSNFESERQDEFYVISDINFRTWKRYQIVRDLRKKDGGKVKNTWKWLANATYGVVAGFGYRPGRFFIVTIALFLVVSYFNYLLIGDAVMIQGVRSSYASFADTVFYSFSILTVLGFSSIVPDGSFAKLLTVFEALVSIGWLGVFSSVLVKRFLR